MRYPAVVAAMAALSACGGPAEKVERACLDAGRGGGGGLCSCVQVAADQTLTGSDQVQAATFFAEPDAAQVMRMSDEGHDERFWRRYERFGAVAEAYCG